MAKRTGASLPLWRFTTPAKAPDTREAAATADVKADFIMLDFWRDCQVGVTNVVV
jgi:hypothetical protein